MTDPRRQAFAPYFRTLADLMGLRDWKVEIDDEGPGSPSVATVGFMFGRRVARIYLSDQFLGSSPEDQRRSAVHELVHPHLEPAWEIATDAMPEPAIPAFKRMMEYAVDAIAVEWAKTLPLPTSPDA